MGEVVTDFSWPPGAHPRETPVFARNEALVEAMPATIWRWLVDARHWPQWYPYARDVRLADARTVLGPNAAFEWTTFRSRVRSRVAAYDAEKHLAWTAATIGTDVYHQWRIDVVRDGCCRVVTEETQRGWAPRCVGPILQRTLVEHHDRWLERLKIVSLGFGDPPRRR
ncbi:MAG: SRPBCC domain-containing protein [Vulcanimicrobiaceae bacterium]